MGAEELAEVGVGVMETGGMESGMVMRDGIPMWSGRAVRASSGSGAAASCVVWYEESRRGGGLRERALWRSSHRGTKRALCSAASLVEKGARGGGMCCAVMLAEVSRAGVPAAGMVLSSVPAVQSGSKGEG